MDSEFGCLPQNKKNLWTIFKNFVQEEMGHSPFLAGTNLPLENAQNIAKS